MVWIKRNLIFVLSAAVGLILMIGAGYYLWSGYSDNKTASDELNQAITELTSLQNKAPAPTKEHIQEAKDSQQQIQAILGQFNSTFAPFPPVATNDEKSFKTLLDKTLAQLQLSATNAGVGLITPYTFSFSGIVSKLSFPSNSIQPWAVQLQEIKSICDVLFASKINFLEGIRRVPVAGDEQGGADYLMAASITNDASIRTPYELTFRAYSGELAAVINGYMRSSNCFIIKNIDIGPSAGSSYSIPTGNAGFSDSRSRRRGPQPIYADPSVAAPGTPVAGSPVTVASEKALRVTLLLEVVKPKDP